MNVSSRSFGGLHRHKRKHSQQSAPDYVTNKALFSSKFQNPEPATPVRHESAEFIFLPPYTNICQENKMTHPPADSSRILSLTHPAVTICIARSIMLTITAKTCSWALPRKGKCLGRSTLPLMKKKAGQCCGRMRVIRASVGKTMKK
jgi:hypothetical protein